MLEEHNEPDNTANNNSVLNSPVNKREAQQVAVVRKERERGSNNNINNNNKPFVFVFDDGDLSDRPDYVKAAKPGYIITTNLSTSPTKRKYPLKKIEIPTNKNNSNSNNNSLKENITSSSTLFIGVPRPITNAPSVSPLPIFYTPAVATPTINNALIAPQPIISNNTNGARVISQSNLINAPRSSSSNIVNVPQSSSNIVNAPQSSSSSNIVNVHHDHLHHQIFRIKKIYDENELPLGSDECLQRL
ncbi:hypothetical protein ACTA71_001764 [Dictyostelium dimigraforme]